MEMDRPMNLKRQIIMSIGIAAAVGATGFVLTRKSTRQLGEPQPPSLSEAVEVSRRGQQITHIEIAKVTEETLSAEIHATGQVLYPSDQTVKISPRMQGRVKAVYVKVGDHVIAGQAIALLESVDAATAQTATRQNENKLRLAKLTIDRTERLFRLGTPEVTSAQATLDQAHSAAITAKEALARTKQQAAIGGFTQPPVETAQNGVIAASGALVQAQSDQAQAQRDRDRKARLVEIGVAAKADLESADNVLSKTHAAVQSDQESLQIARQALDREQKALKTDFYSEQIVRVAEAAYRQAALQESASARSLRLAKAAILTSLQQARSDCQTAQNDVDNSHRVLSMLGHPDAEGTVRIVAPISGVIIDRQVSPGQVVDQSQMTPWQMFVLSNAASVWIDADVFEKDIAAIAPGQQAAIRISALPGKDFRGSVLRIAPAVDKTSRAIKVRVEIANREGLLKDGMYASMTIFPGKGRRVLTVPAAAVQHDGDSDYVFVPMNAKYARRKIELGAHIKDRYVVNSGLQVGDSIVSRGAIFVASQMNGG